MKSLFTLDPKLRPSAEDIILRIIEGWDLPKQYSDITVRQETE